MGEEYQAEDLFSHGPQLRSVGLDHHAFNCLRGAGSNRLFISLDFNDAETAGADGEKLLHIAERGNKDTIAPRSTEKGFALCCFYGLSVNYYLHGYPFRPFLYP